MIVNRREFNIEVGHVEDAIAWMKALQFPKPIRIVTSLSGPFNVLAIEIEFESLAESERLMAEWAGRSDSAQLLAKWHEINKSGVNEYWQVVD
jgi:hypothetical protein